MSYVSGYKLFVGNEIQNMFVPGTTDSANKEVNF